MNYHIDVDVIGDEELAAAFELAPQDMDVSLVPVVDKSAQRLQRDWRAMARKSAGRHGKHYPSSITADLYRQEGSVYADIGPDSAKPQGGMGRGFEYGSVHTAPHPDGAVAFEQNVPRFVDAVEAKVDQVIRDVLG